MNRFLTECSQKLFCMLYGSKKEFDNFAMLYINRKIAMQFTTRYEGKNVLKKDSIFKTIFKISDLNVLHQITY